MIDYAYLCHALQSWRAGARPTNPPVPSSEYEELDADVMVDDEEQAYEAGGYAEQSHADQGYAEQGYAEQGYAEQGYAEQGYAEQGYAEQGYAEQAAPPQTYEETVQHYESYEQPEPGDVTMAYGASVPDDDEDRS